MNWNWDFFIGFLFGYAVAHWGPRLYERARIAHQKWKMGICFHYQRGPWTEVNGTLSHHCLRCGHPAGYHWNDKRVR